MTFDYCSLTLGNFILTLEKLGPKVNDSWDTGPSENPEKLGPKVNDSWDIGPSENPEIKIKTNQF